MNYVFVFLGEFGYELFNWQGVVRKFSKTISSMDDIICCSRASLSPLYESASYFIDLSELGIFKNSVASMYFALRPTQFAAYKNDKRQLKKKFKSFVFQIYEKALHYVKLPDWDNLWKPVAHAYRNFRPEKNLDICSLENLTFDQELKKELKSFILQELELRHGRRDDIVFIFSSDRTQLNGCVFGCDRRLAALGDPLEGNIYQKLDLKNNTFQKIEADISVRHSIERKLGWNLAKPFILVQTRNRDIGVRSDALVPKEPLIEELARRYEIVLLSFQTGRSLDSYSKFREIENTYSYISRSFLEQACLIHYAKHCVFFTEGDFGSHIYVPPFLGNNVFAIAPRAVYHLDTIVDIPWSTTPIEFWNRNVFQFGGQIIAKVSEEVFESRKSMLQLVDEIVSSDQ